MARKDNLNNYLTDVASAIKAKKKDNTAIAADQFDTEILNLQGDYETRTINVSQNGTQTITPTSGKDAISQVTINTAVPEKSLQQKSYAFTENIAQLDLVPDANYDGFSKVRVGIAVPTEQVLNQDKTVNPSTSAQTITHDAGYTGLGDVTVTAVDNTIDSDIIASNIKSGVNILGVDGSLIELNGEIKDITPTTSNQTIYPTSGKNAMTQVNVSAVDNTIDSNITAENIKKDVTILGVTGTYESAQINNQDKSVTPTTGQQSISADAGYTGLGTVTVGAVTSAIDPDIQATNIKSGVNILGVSGSVIELNGETKTVTPSTSQQVIGPSDGKNAITEVTVEAIATETKSITPTTSSQTIYPTSGKFIDEIDVDAVTSSIDANIIAGNIKDGVTILGVTGDYEGAVINNQNKTVSPSTSSQSVTADTGYTGLGTVTVDAVTSSIDADIKTTNIKNGVDILGIVGQLPFTGVYKKVSDFPSASAESGNYAIYNEALPADYPAKPDSNSKYGVFSPVTSEDVYMMTWNKTPLYIHYISSANYVKFTQNTNAYSPGVTVSIYKLVNNQWSVQAQDEAIRSSSLMSVLRGANTMLGGNDVIYAGTNWSVAAGQIAYDFLNADVEYYPHLYKSINNTWTEVLIDTTTGNVSAGDILSGKVAFSKNTQVVGSMPNNGALSITPSTSSQSIPAGYTSGGTVSAVDSTIDNNIVAGNIKNGVTILGVTGSYAGIDTSDATATAVDILEDKTAYVNGTKITGTYTWDSDSNYATCLDLTEQILGSTPPGPTPTPSFTTLFSQYEVPISLASTFNAIVINKDLDTVDVVPTEYKSNMEGNPLEISFNTSYSSASDNVFRLYLQAISTSQYTDPLNSFGMVARLAYETATPSSLDAAIMDKRAVWNRTGLSSADYEWELDGKGSAEQSASVDYLIPTASIGNEQLIISPNADSLALGTYSGMQDYIIGQFGEIVHFYNLPAAVVQEYSEYMYNPPSPVVYQ